MDAYVKRTLALAGFVVLLLHPATVRAQKPDTIIIPARSPFYSMSHARLLQGVYYKLEIRGMISYWQTTIDSSAPDADADAVWHVPQLPNVSPAVMARANAFLTQGRQLPLDKGFCQPNPDTILCPTKPPRVFRTAIPETDSCGLQKGYLEVNRWPFCPRVGPNGGGTLHVYPQLIAGNNGFMSFKCIDPDGDYSNNAGTLTAIIRRIEPILDVTHDTIDFGVVRIGATNNTVLRDTVWNLGALPLPGCNNVKPLQIRMSVTGDTTTAMPDGEGFHIYGMRDSVSLAQEDSFTVAATFNPKVLWRATPYKAVIRLLTNDVQNPMHEIVLLGRPKQGWIKTTDTLDFGDVPLNSSKIMTATIENIGNDSMRLRDFYIDSNRSIGFSPFGPVPRNLPLRAGGGDRVQVKFAPNQLGMHTGIAVVWSNALNIQHDTIYLKGRGVRAILFYQDTLDFGDLPLGQTDTNFVTLRNLGNIPFTVQFVRFTAGDSSDFSAEPRTSVIVQPGDSVQWLMSFSPRQIGRRLAIAEVADEANFKYPVYVFGNGTIHSSMTVSGRVDFDTVALGDTLRRTATVRNVGNVPITLLDATIPPATPFEVVQTRYPRILPNDSLPVLVEFHPVIEGQATSYLTLRDDSLRSYRVAVTGYGKRYIGVLKAADTLDFGNVFLGDSKDSTVGLRNVGNARLVLAKAGFTTGDLADFTINPLLPIRIAIAGSDSTPASFTPTQAGIREARIEFTDSTQQQSTILLMGNGLTPLTGVFAVDAYSARVGSLVTIPVDNRTDIAATLSDSFRLQLHYDPVVLMPRSVAPVAPMTPGYNMAWNESPSGTLTISATGAVPLAGTGPVCTVTFEVLASPRQSTPIGITDLHIGDGRNPRRVQSVDGSFTITGECGGPVVARSALVSMLASNNPNPFTGETRLVYNVGVPGHVTIKVYNTLGQIVRTITDADHASGRYSLLLAGAGLPEGMYVCRMDAPGYVGSLQIIRAR